MVYFVHVDRMVRASFVFALFFLICVNAAPAPEAIEIPWVQNSTINVDLDYIRKVKDVVDSIRTLKLPNEEANKASNIPGQENVNSSASDLLGSHVDVDKIVSLGRSITDKIFPAVDEKVREFISALRS